MIDSIQPETPEPVTGRELVLPADSGKSLTRTPSSKAPDTRKSAPVNGSRPHAETQDSSTGRGKLSTHQRRTLARELAQGDVTRASLARKYGVSRPAITKFAKRHAAEISAIAADLQDEFAGQWIAQKELRIEQYQRDLELSAEGDFAGHYEQIRTRTQILHNVAEETGQLPTRGNITVIPVTHTVVGIDTDLLR